MNQAWVRPIIIAGGVVILLALNAREFAGKRRALASEHQAILRIPVILNVQSGPS